MNGFTLQANLIAIEIQKFDIILGMDLLTKDNTIDKCFNRTVTFKTKD